MKNTKSLILNTTIEWISEKDYREISLRTLTNSIGITTGAFYKHFNNKEDLYYQVSILLSQELTERLNLDITADPTSELLKVAEQICLLFQNEPYLMAFIMLNQSNNLDRQNFVFLDAINKLIQRVNPTKNEQSNKALFIQLWSFIQGYGALIKNGVTNYDRGLVKNTLYKLLEK
ncbi:TetR/AcrR family transcriptional regulator [Leuconostoc rapi]|uniref:TetR/AcrR family transcriptional regulator n=1 Tax=Leuconostoc rapi TaxID=1406906 RepID=UPI00195DB5BB|nr:TetR/AcrR family transcriptional regulator [Leuconostoc rapi]MBM7435121.1 AcrR family transcriptional regulator [Leuconostoc rapi]